MRIRSVIRNILPFGIINRRRLASKRLLIEELFFNMKEGDFVDLTIPVPSKFKNVVSVQGFGYSGSGAVVDLLREYSNCFVMGYVSVEGSQAPRKDSMAEIDFVRLAGGLFEIEKFIDNDNFFQNDALVNRTIRLFNSAYLFRNPDLRIYFLSFLHAIIEHALPNLSQPYYNASLYDPEVSTSIYFLRKMPIQEYRAICRNFLNIIFNYFHTEGKDYFVADQIFADEAFDYKKLKDYCPNFKTVVIPRDPRDLYAWTNYKKVEWIPQDLHSFIKWYNIIYSQLKQDQPDSLVIRYEEMCLDYDNQYPKVANFIGLDEKLHLHKLECFNPDFSKKYVNIWKQSEMRKEDFDMIMKELGDYCCHLVD